MEPKHNFVIIEQDKNETQSAGSIIVADMGKEKPKTGTVIATGPGMYNTEGKLIPLQTKKGERVLFPSFGGTRVMVGGKEYVAIKDIDIILSF